MIRVLIKGAEAAGTDLTPSLTQASAITLLIWTPSSDGEADDSEGGCDGSNITDEDSDAQDNKGVASESSLFETREAFEAVPDGWYVGIVTRKCSPSFQPENGRLQLRMGPGTPNQGRWRPGAVALVCSQLLYSELGVRVHWHQY
eukprot:1565572-Rhodomonas_salina.3